MTDSVKIYSRKEVISWVESITKFKYDQLKNGVCFCKIVQKKFPEQFVKIKFNQKPISEFDFTNNLNIVKKVLNKHFLQLNMNVNTILNSKNCFEFANWMKNLTDGLILIPNSDYYTVESQEKLQSEENPLSTRLGNMTKRDSCSSKSGQKTHSLAKSGRPYSTTKSEVPFVKIKTIKTGKNLVQVNKQLPPLINNRSHVNKLKKSGIQSEFDLIQDCSEALYELSLQQSIGQFKKILKKVQSTVQNEQFDSLQEFLQTIKKCLYQK